jgi:hypothetical protein
MRIIEKVATAALLVCMRVWVRVCVCLCVCVRACVCVCVCVCVRSCVRACVRASVCMCAHTHACLCVHMYACARACLMGRVRAHVLQFECYPRGARLSICAVPKPAFPLLPYPHKPPLYTHQRSHPPPHMRVDTSIITLTRTSTHPPIHRATRRHLLSTSGSTATPFAADTP